VADENEREFAITVTYIVRARSAMEAVTAMGDREPDRITIMPNMGV